MLDENEWELIAPSLNNAISDIKRFSDTHEVSLTEARAHGYGREALAVYCHITGFHETNPDALWHHRLSLYGPSCCTCGKPLRTPQAKLCAECGTPRQEDPELTRET